LHITAAILATALGLHSPEDVVEDRVDLIEVNHFFDERGRLVFDQVIFYEWTPAHGRYQVRTWRLLKSPAQLPQRDWSRGDYVTVWHDGDLLRKVRTAAVRETWTQHDPELIDREHLPKECRRGLPQPVGDGVLRR
jgi:hypothetical protein